MLQNDLFGEVVSPKKVMNVSAISFEEASKNKFYPTPLWVADAIIEKFFPELDESCRVCEPSCGDGRFLKAVPARVPAIGVELHPGLAEKARRETGRQVITGDFCTVNLDFEPTHIIGNPPFDMSILDGFLDRVHRLLPEGGRAGFILPTYAFQTAGRVCRYNERWAIRQEMIPRNIYPVLSTPLVFALFSKDREQTLVGFALYREALDTSKLADPYRSLMEDAPRSLWRAVVETALRQLGGEADLKSLYREVEQHRPFDNPYWRERIRNVVGNSRAFTRVGKGRYALATS